MSHTIAFVSDAISPYNKGGKETRLFEITTRLAARGHDVHIYCMQWWEGPSNREENGVHLHAISPYIPLYDGPRRSIKQGVLFGLACFKLLTKKFDIADVDHMPFFPIFSMRIVCWLKGKPLIATWHEVWGKQYWQTYVGSIKGIFANIIESVAIRLPNTIIAVSKLTASRLKDSGFSGKLVIVQNGIDIQKIKTAKKSNITSDVMFAGRLLTHKNVLLLLESLAILKKTQPQIKAVIIGEGPEEEALKQYVSRLGLSQSVQILPFEKDIRTLYGVMKASKVFVLPSNREGFGLVVLEANAAGLPVITLDHPDNAAKDLITKQNGLLTSESATDLADKIKHALAVNWQSLDQINLDQHSWDTQIQALEKIYQLK